MGVGTGRVGVGLNKGKIRKREFYRKECGKFQEAQGVLWRTSAYGDQTCVYSVCQGCSGLWNITSSTKWTESTSGSEARTRGPAGFMGGGLNIQLQGEKSAVRYKLQGGCYSYKTIKFPLVKEAYFSLDQRGKICHCYLMIQWLYHWPINCSAQPQTLKLSNSKTKQGTRLLHPPLNVVQMYCERGK